MTDRTAKTGLLYMPAAEVREIARTLMITDFDTGVSIPWEPTEMQWRCWEAREHHQRLFVTKPRRAYVTTAYDLDDVIFTLINDQDSERVRSGVALDTDAHVDERIVQMSDFFEQLGVPHEAKEGVIELGGAGSQIAVFTAGGKRAGASTGFQRMRYSEAGYYKAGQIATISAAVGKQADEIIETTVGAHAENFVEARARWKAVGAWKPYHQLFLPFELHPEYRAPPELITDQEWEWAQTEGFAIREAAAYWLAEVLPKFGGDMQRALGEYPQRVEHLFAVAANRWVNVTPPVLKPVSWVDVPGIDGATHKLLIYIAPKDSSGQASIGADTASGKERSRSAVTVVDNKDGKLLAAWLSDTAPTDDIANIALVAQHMYTTTSPVTMKRYSAHALIEENGIGAATCQAARRMALDFEPVNMTEEKRYLCLLAAKRAVETGALRGPPELAEECDELHRDEHGRWKGRKDLLMAYGFAALHRSAIGFKHEPGPVDDRVRVNKRIAMARREQRGRQW